MVHISAIYSIFRRSSQQSLDATVMLDNLPCRKSRHAETERFLADRHANRQVKGKTITNVSAGQLPRED